jgi:hypothetical protein
MVGGNACHDLLGVTDKILTHAEIKHYTNIGIHNDYYTLVITVIGIIRFYRTEYNRKQQTVSSHTIIFLVKNHFC